MNHHLSEGNDPAADAFIGQKDAVEIVRAWRVQPNTQALLLSGSKGTGRRTLARRIAASLLCLNPDASTLSACGQCASCRYLAAGTHPDFHHLAAEDKERNIPIDRIRREVIADIGLKPQLGQRKVYLIEADDLAEAAQNALLKTLEEPYSYAYLILTVRQPSALLPTTLSRLQLIRLTSYSDAEMRAILRRHGVTDEKLIRQVLPASGGIPGTALTLAASEWFAGLRSDVFAIMGKLGSRIRAEAITEDVKTLMDLVKGLDSRQDVMERWNMAFELMEGWLRDLILLSVPHGADSLIHTDQEAWISGTVSRLSGRFGDVDDNAIMGRVRDKAYNCLEAVGDCRQALNQNVNTDMAVSRLMLILHRELH